MTFRLFRDLTVCIAIALTVVSCHAQQSVQQEIPTAFVLPACIDSNAVVHHHAFSLEYSEADEQPRWVAYIICRSRIDGPYSRKSTPGCQFRADNAVRTQSASPADYKGSGYSRGHLVPAADMKWDSLAQVETFLLSNISPQRDNFNSGVWNRMEMQVRRWADEYDTLFVVTGPLLMDGGAEQIGINQVTVPTAFYKAIYFPARHQAVGFLIPHEKSKAALSTFAMSIDELETRTGIDFFAGMPDEAAIESSFDIIIDK